MVLKVNAVRAEVSVVTMTWRHQVLNKRCSKMVAEASGRPSTGVDHTSKEFSSKLTA